MCEHKADQNGTRLHMDVLASTRPWTRPGLPQVRELDVQHPRVRVGCSAPATRQPPAARHARLADEHEDVHRLLVRRASGSRRQGHQQEQQHLPERHVRRWARQASETQRTKPEEDTDNSSRSATATSSPSSTYSGRRFSRSSTTRSSTRRAARMRTSISARYLASAMTWLSFVCAAADVLRKPSRSSSAAASCSSTRPSPSSSSARDSTSASSRCMASHVHSTPRTGRSRSAVRSPSRTSTPTSSASSRLNISHNKRYTYIYLLQKRKHAYLNGIHLISQQNG